MVQADSQMGLRVLNEEAREGATEKERERERKTKDR
jgi:hypothetical protein